MMKYSTLAFCSFSFDISEFRGRRGTALFAFDVVVHDFQRSIPMALCYLFLFRRLGRRAFSPTPGFLLGLKKKRKVAHVFRSIFMDIRVSGEAFRKTNV